MKLCHKCGSEIDSGWFCMACREKEGKDAYERHKQRLRWQKEQVFNHYGGNPPVCACCGESEFRFLTLDHIDGGGTRERNSTKFGANMYLHLIKDGYPEGVQILCSNCNMSKGRSRQRFCPVHHPELFK